MEDHTKLKNDFSSREKEREIISSDNLSINATPKINLLKEKTGIQMSASDVDRKITGSYII